MGKRKNKQIHSMCAFYDVLKDMSDKATEALQVPADYREQFVQEFRRGSIATLDAQTSRRS